MGGGLVNWCGEKRRMYKIGIWHWIFVAASLSKPVLEDLVNVFFTSVTLEQTNICFSNTFKDIIRQSVSKLICLTLAK